MGDLNWRCDTHKNGYNACWACMVVARERDIREAQRAYWNAALEAAAKETTNSRIKHAILGLRQAPVDTTAKNG